MLLAATKKVLRTVYTCATCGTKFTGPLCPKCN